jgi:hypothetical protein
MNASMALLTVVHIVSSDATGGAATSASVPADATSWIDATFSPALGFRLGQSSVLDIPLSVYWRPVSRLGVGLTAARTFISESHAASSAAPGRFEEEQSDVYRAGAAARWYFHLQPGSRGWLGLELGALIVSATGAVRDPSGATPPRNASKVVAAPMASGAAGFALGVGRYLSLGVELRVQCATLTDPIDARMMLMGGPIVAVHLPLAAR